MGRYMLFLAALFLTGFAALLSSNDVNAGSHIALPQTVSKIAPQSAPLILAGYYGDRSYSGYGYNDEGDHHTHGPHCSHSGYSKKYVCEYGEPRCFKQRECIWHYGREYCRYVKKCVGGEKYCKWITVPVSYH